jgi:hypothetical protein
MLDELEAVLEGAEGIGLERHHFNEPFLVRER